MLESQRDSPCTSSLRLPSVINLYNPFEVVGIKVCYILTLTHTSEILKMIKITRKETLASQENKSMGSRKEIWLDNLK